MLTRCTDVGNTKLTLSSQAGQAAELQISTWPLQPPACMQGHLISLHTHSRGAASLQTTARQHVTKKGSQQALLLSYFLRWENKSIGIHYTSPSIWLINQLVNGTPKSNPSMTEREMHFLLFLFGPLNYPPHTHFLHHSAFIMWVN